MGQRTDDLLFAVYEQLVSLNSVASTNTTLLEEIRDELKSGGGARLAEPHRPSTIGLDPDPRVQPERSSNLGDPRLSESIAQYLEQKQHEVSPQHHDVVRLTLAGFLHWLPFHAANVTQVTKQLMNGYRQHLLDAGRTIKTVNNHMAIIAAFFNWAVQLGLVDENPAAGLKLKDRTAISRRRKAFSSEEITHVMADIANNFGGLLSGGNAKGWLPLIMLYTGARPEEVAQLRVCDVRQVPVDRTQPYPAEPISPQTPIPPLWGGPVKWVFDFATMDDGQRRKNEASRRLVPVHPRLWELGLRGLVVRPGGSETDMLFPELKPGANGRLAEAPSRWFNRTWLREVKGISDRKLVLYSIRHSVATTLKHQGVEESMIAQLLGHSNQSMTTGRYGKEYPIEKLSEVVARLQWDL